MAIASKQVVVIKPEQVIPAVARYMEKIVLELSKEEAETLREILQYIGGSPDYSPRRHADAMQEALESQGVGRVAPVDENGNPTEYVFMEGSAASLHFRRYCEFVTIKM